MIKLLCIVVVTQLSACAAKRDDRDLHATAAAEFGITKTVVASMPLVGVLTDLKIDVARDEIYAVGSRGTAVATLSDGQLRSSFLLRSQTPSRSGNHKLFDLDGDNAYEVVQAGEPVGLREYEAYKFEGESLWTIEPRWAKVNSYCGEVRVAWWLRNAKAAPEGIIWATCNSEAIVLGPDGRERRRIPWSQLNGSSDPDIVSFIADFDDDGSDDVCAATGRRIEVRNKDGGVITEAALPSGEYVNGLRLIGRDSGVIKGIASGNEPQRAVFVPGRHHDYSFAYDLQNKLWTFAPLAGGRWHRVVARAERRDDGDTWWRAYSEGAASGGVFTVQLISNDGALLAEAKLSAPKLDVPPSERRAICVLPASPTRSDLFIGWGSDVWRLEATRIHAERLLDQQSE